MVRAGFVETGLALKRANILLENDRVVPDDDCDANRRAITVCRQGKICQDRNSEHVRTARVSVSLPIHEDDTRT